MGCGMPVRSRSRCSIRSRRFPHEEAQHAERDAGEDGDEERPPPAERRLGHLRADHEPQALPTGMAM